MLKKTRGFIPLVYNRDALCFFWFLQKEFIYQNTKPTAFIPMRQSTQQGLQATGGRTVYSAKHSHGKTASQFVPINM